MFHLCAVIVNGIIPARAGFTSRPWWRHRPQSDHPRSRGVYFSFDERHHELAGSSPLARGLRRRSGRVIGHTRIIPARAGFTQAIRAGHRTHQDHPRSRGVYKPSEAEPQLVAGSSPLARGLPHSHTGGRIVGRIIPARAGFTSRRDGHLHGAQDHPRSRGVYVPAWLSLHTVPGSSPLARGLRVGVMVTYTVHRIIPARAGFTCLPG